MISNANEGEQRLVDYINLKLAVLGMAPVATAGEMEFEELAAPLIEQHREKDRLLGNHLCPVDQRIQAFLFDYLQDTQVPRLPARTFVLDQLGLARVLSLPPKSNKFQSSILTSFRVRNGVL